MPETIDDPSGGASASLDFRAERVRALLYVLALGTLAALPVRTWTALVGFPLPLGIATTLAFALAGVKHRSGVRWTRPVAAIAMVVWAAGAVAEHADPARGLGILVGLIATLATLWPSTRLSAYVDDTRTPSGSSDLLLASSAALLFGLDRWLMRDTTLAAEAALAGTYLLPVVIAYSRRRRVGWLTGTLALAGALALLPLIEAVSGAAGVTLGVGPLGLLSPVVMLALSVRSLALQLLRPGEASEDPGLIDLILVHPSRALVLSFVALTGIGTFLLALPIASQGEPVAWLDAAFTAVSAACVTGLGVLDMPHTFSGVGQVMILVLIQIGGLGIMVFSAAAVVLLGRRLSLSHERAAVDIVGASSRAGLGQAIGVLLKVTFIAEAIAAVFFAVGFIARGDSLAMGAWRGLFTSISAFCNAGFALQSDSLVSYADSPYILSVAALTIIVGAMGPAVIVALRFGDRRRFSLHAKLVLWTTAILLIVPTALFALLEWNTTLAGLTPIDRLFNAMFQSTTMRTAGFNSIDLAQVHPVSWTAMILLMYIGGSPGSTAGGIKTTTIALVVLSIVAAIRGHDRVEIFGRTVPQATVQRALTVAALAAFVAGLTLAAVQLTQTIPLDEAIFEVVSALATVGLTTGGTGQLDEVGKVIIIVAMFAGRVGPLTLFVFLASNTPATTRRGLPEESVPIG